MESNLSLKELHDPEVFQQILALDIEKLTDVVSFRKTATEEVKLAFRDLNNFSRANYANFIKQVGRNIYPFIIASDHEENSFSGVGTTFHLYLEDGSEMTMTPALHTNYEIYKSVSHIFLGLFTFLSPYLQNTCALSMLDPLRQFKIKLECAHSAVERSQDTSLKKELLLTLLGNAISFVSTVLEAESFTREEYVAFNKSNILNLKECFVAATKSQAEANIAALLKWKNMLGPEKWREVFVVIPTVFPVATNNPRIEIFRNLMDEDKLKTNIIASESPRNAEESRTLIGRVVGDRSLGRIVFGDGFHEAQMKTVGLSTGIDAVLDDAIPEIHEVLRKHGIEPRPFKAAFPTTGCPIAHSKD